MNPSPKQQTSDLSPFLAVAIAILLGIFASLSYYLPSLEEVIELVSGFFA